MSLLTDFDLNLIFKPNQSYLKFWINKFRSQYGGLNGK